ncbi:MAG TPA: hypothetical protein VMH78_08970 [Thermoplasmata archaeon]|nr:hypothetical protein [Thermoplasmata archaeon]
MRRPIDRAGLPLVGLAAGVGLLMTVGGGPYGLAVEPVLLPLVLLGALLRRRLGPLAPLAGVPVSVGLLVGAVQLVPSLATFAVAVAGGISAVLWIGVPVAPDADPTAGDIVRELALPIGAGAAAIVGAAIPLVAYTHSAGIVIAVFAGLALLVVFLAEVALPTWIPRRAPR